MRVAMAASAFEEHRDKEKMQFSNRQSQTAGPGLSPGVSAKLCPM